MGLGVPTWFAVALLAAAPAAGATSTRVPVLAATPQFRHYNIDQGLPSSNVYTVVQDRHGVVWMGTITGLARFDGKQFKVYRHIPDQATSLASDDVSSVLADAKGRLWAGGEGSGVNLYRPASDDFRHFRHQPGRADSLSGNDVMAMAEGRAGTLWVGTYGHGLDHMTSPGHFRHFLHDPHDPHSLASDNVLALFSRGKGTLWIGTDAGLDIRTADGRLRHAHFPGLEHPPTVWGIDGDAHQVRVGTSAGLFVVDADGVARRLLPRVLPHVSVICSVRDRHGDLWVGTGSGLYLVHHGQVTHFPPRPLLPGGQPGQLVWKLMLDHEGGLWVATQNGGVAYLNPDWRDFSHDSHRPDDASSLSNSHVRALAADGHGKLWVGGGRNQLDKLDPATGTVTHLGKELGSTPRRILAMARAGPHGLWLGFGGGLGLFDHGRLHMVATPPHVRGYRRMVVGPDGTLYAAPVGEGMYRVDRRSLRATPLALAFTAPSDRQTTDLLLHDGQLWRASHAGLSRLPIHGQHLVPVPGVAPGQVTALAIAGDDLWLIRPGGLEHYRLHGHRARLLRRIDADHGWPGIVAYSMLVDRRGRVWMFGNAGLWRYDPATGRFHRYGKENGLPSPEFTTRRPVRMGRETVFAGTLDGVIGFHPAAIDDHLRKPLLEISSVVVNRDGHDIRLPLDSRHLHLRWNDRDLRITAHASSYIDPQHNHYRFRLVGLDPDWVDTGTRGVRELAGLAAGHYRLKVEAAGPSGAWSRLARPLSIEVDAPPWATPWAWLVYVLVALVLVWIGFALWRRRLEQRHRLQMVEQRRRMAEQANDAKSRFLATLSHEIRTPMTGVLGMAELLLASGIGPREHGYAEAIHHSGELLLKLVNDALDMARIEAGHFELEPGPLYPRTLLEEVRRLLSGQVQGKPLALRVTVDEDVPACLQGDAMRIQQILLNLANNAIKFTERGEVRIHAGYTDGRLRLVVSDTGPGISAADRERLFQRFEQADGPQRRSGSGLGLAICRELVALMHGRIGLDSTPGQGSRFEVVLPLPPMAAPDGPATDTPAATQPLRLLLVEDDATVARVIRGLLEARGHHVTHAGHGLGALGELEADTFDVMLLDLDLPGVDGYQLAGMVRQRETGARHLPIIAITARSGGDEESRARAAGMDAFARKPLGGAQLEQLLRQLCHP